MSATTGYTVFFAENDGAMRRATDYLLTDNSVLYVTIDHGAVWRCLGLVDANEVLVHFGLRDAGCDEFVAGSMPAPGWGPAPAAL